MRERQNFTPAKLYSVAGLLFLVAVFVVPRFSQAAFSEPGTTPLTGTPLTFLNGSAATQTKTGSLMIGPGGGSALICLNANTALSIYDPANIAPPSPGIPTCIDSWADLAPVVGFVRRQQNTTPSDPSRASTYGAADRGFATVLARGTAPYNQALATVVKVNTAASGVKYALYATDGGANTRSAGQLSGQTIISNATNTAELCLNGQCIRRWGDAFGFAAGLIHLQDTAGNPYLLSDPGHASVSGVTHFTRSLTVGRPTYTTPLQWSYGDGHCTAENGETELNSPNDCI